MASLYFFLFLVDYPIALIYYDDTLSSCFLDFVELIIYYMNDESYYYYFMHAMMRKRLVCRLRARCARSMIYWGLGFRF